jgi:hypothetical protein
MREATLRWHPRNSIILPPRTRLPLQTKRRLHWRGIHLWKDLRLSKGKWSTSSSNQSLKGHLVKWDSQSFSISSNTALIKDRRLRSIKQQEVSLLQLQIRTVQVYFLRNLHSQAKTRLSYQINLLRHQLFKLAPLRESALSHLYMKELAISLTSPLHEPLDHQGRTLKPFTRWLETWKRRLTVHSRWLSRRRCR